MTAASFEPVFRIPAGMRFVERDKLHEASEATQCIMWRGCCERFRLFRKFVGHGMIAEQKEGLCKAEVSGESLRNFSKTVGEDRLAGAIHSC